MKSERKPPLIKREFAFLPVLIRNKLPTSGPFRKQEWVIFKWYTRVYRWDVYLDRYKTYDTFLEKVPQKSRNEILSYVGGTPHA